MIRLDHFLGRHDDVQLQDGDVNLSEICRLCRNSKGVMSYIFSNSGVDNSLPLSQRIMSFINIDMHEGDGLPSLICHRCLYHVEQINEFKIQCEQSDALLRQIVSYHGVKTFKDISMLERQCNGVNENDYSEEEYCIKKEKTSDNEEEINGDENETKSDDGVNNCPTCNKHFDDEKKLERHQLIHSQDGPFPCDYCEMSMSDKAELRLHWRQEHAGSNCHMCQTCGESFVNREHLLKHHLRHDKVKPYRCSEPSCKKAFSYRSDLRKHLVIHTAFTRSTNLNKHARVHSGRRPFSCGECDKMFATRGDLIRHSFIHTGVKPYSCPICCLSFNRKDKLTRHEKLHKEQRAHMCNICPTSFNRKEELTKHIQFHHFLPPSSYEEDSTETGSQRENEKYSDENGGDHLEFPERVSEDTEDVVINVDPLNWTETKHQCQMCDRSFKTIEDLTKHKASHEKSRNFICEICFKGFHQRRELVRHSLTHTGFKPFSCETCGKAFSRRDKLTRHMRTHIMPKRTSKAIYKEPPTCEICLKVLSSPHELSRHILTHSFFKPYQCNYCTSSYCRKDKLVKHIRNIHSEQIPENEIKNISP
ncbi:zinc finger protein 883-like isoform X2 [Cimex lectularius]|uniref:Zinc finger protein n=1 Tax=Cimex lectularius TaxID=79782 RepID=A0A8I6RT14_CIMLE|nr:zinc finger protein 883-like isoform X2 [Cimex lectularius]